MKKILFLLGAIITFIFSGTGAIKEINDMLQHESGQQTK
jgi:H+/gluconate symporter-like permease